MKQIILLAILTFSFLVNAFGQSTTDDKVLANGNPPLTQNMVEKSRDLFEFTFGGALNDNEKRIYQDELIRRWQGSDAETIKAIQDLVGFHEKMAGLGREKLPVLQNQMREPLVRDLRAQASKDSMARMLVEAYERIQGLNAKQGGNLPPPSNVQQQQQYQQADVRTQPQQTRKRRTSALVLL